MNITTRVPFEDVIAWGREHADSVVDGVPWSFTYKGFHFTHEHDDLYLIGGCDVRQGPQGLSFKQGDLLRIDEGPFMTHLAVMRDSRVSQTLTRWGKRDEQ